MKKALAVIGILIAIYAAFVTVDCVRLKTAPKGTKPIIAVSETETENREKYTGLGYSVCYYTDKSSGEAENIYGAEFRLFDKFLVWGWVE